MAGSTVAFPGHLARHLEYSVVEWLYDPVGQTATQMAVIFSAKPSALEGHMETHFCVEFSPNQAVEGLVTAFPKHLATQYLHSGADFSKAYVSMEHLLTQIALVFSAKDPAGQIAMQSHVRLFPKKAVEGSVLAFPGHLA